MKNFLFCIILFIIVPVISCQAKALAVFDETIFEFGKVKTESTLKHTFNFQNKGTSTLVIERIKTG